MLRDYQQIAIQKIRDEWARGNKRVLLRMATGSGKTVIFCFAMQSAVTKGMKTIMVVRGRQLVDQASKRLFVEDVAHGVRMAKHWNKNYLAPAQVCSVDTLISRNDFPPADLVIIDEADQATSDSYVRLAAMYPNAYFLSVTATPYTDKPLRHIAQAIVHPITMQTLMDKGWLCPFRYFAPNEPDLIGVKIVNKEYQNDQLSERMSTLTGDIITHWRNLGEGRPTLCFAVNVKHSRQIVDMFRGAGISAEHADANTSDGEREEIFKRLQRGETKILCNVGIATRGVDLPFVSCLIMARPTRSLNLYIQMAGRGTRILDGKSNCILLDHAGNILRHGLPTDEPEVNLDGKIKRRSINEVKICKTCFMAYKGVWCPECGPKIKDETSVDITMDGGTLEEIVVTKKDPVEQFLELLQQQRERKGYKSGWVWHKLIEKFGRERVEHLLPKWFGQDDVWANSKFQTYGGKWK